MALVADLISTIFFKHDMQNDLLLLLLYYLFITFNIQES